MTFRQAKWWLLHLFCFTAEAAIHQNSRLRKLQDNTKVPIGFQSGPDPGATYGGSIVYRPDSKRIYITGATNGTYFKSVDSNNPTSTSSSAQTACFLGIADLSSADNGGTSLTWAHAQQWETRVPEACNVIYVDRNARNLPENNTRIQEKLYLLGFTEKNGLLEELRIQSVFPAQQYGMILDVDVLSIQPGSSEFTTTFWGGRLLHDGPVQYPIDMTLDEDGNIYVVSLQSYDSKPTTRSASMVQVAKQMVNPWLKPYGSDYNMLIEQFLYDNPGYDDGFGVPEDPNNVQLDTTIVDNWRKPFSPQEDSAGAMVAGIEYLGGVLIVVGSTDGHSDVFGNEIVTNSNRTDTSMNGYVTKIIPDSGSYYQFVVDNGATESDAGQPMHKRSATAFASIDFKDDYIMGMCSSPADPDNFYIVGTTEGQIDRQIDTLVQGEVHAFLMKVNVWSLLASWTKQIGGDAVRKDVVRGLTCAVTEDAQDVYMAGTVENGGSLSLYNQESHGQDDIFLLQVDKDGKLVFLRQIGTSGNDRLSPNGLATDEYGNAILMGHTDGSFFRSRQHDQESEKSDDLFIMTVIRGTGEYKESLSADAPTAGPDTNGDAAPQETTSSATAEPELAETPVADPTPQTTPVGEDTPSNSGTSKPYKEPMIYTASGSAEHPQVFNAEPAEQVEPAPAQGRQRYGLVLFFILLAIVGLITGLLAYRRMTRAEPVTDRDEVVAYLNDFDVDDIDLKQSATGGYHCSYTNDLAHGINARAVSREGLFGPLGFSAKPGAAGDPLLRVHSRDSREGGEILFSDEHSDRDDVSSIGSGIGTPGRHSTHDRDPLLDTYDGDGRPPNDMVF